MPPTTEFVHANRSILEEYTSGLKIGPFLGKGAWGSVFATNDPEWVVKVTKDFLEHPAIHTVLNLRKKGEALPGLVEILSSEEVDGLEDDGEPLYVIVRERISPVEDTWFNKKELAELDEAMYRVEESQAYSEEEVRDASRSLCRKVPAVMDTFFRLKKLGYILADFAPQNVGITLSSRLRPAGAAVLFDVSFMDMP